MTRLIIDEPGQAELSLGSLTLRGTYPGLGTLVGAAGLVALTALFLLLRDLYRRCVRCANGLEERKLARLPPHERRLAIDARRRRRAKSIATRLFGATADMQEKCAAAPATRHLPHSRVSPPCATIGCHSRQPPPPASSPLATTYACMLAPGFR